MNVHNEYYILFLQPFVFLLASISLVKLFYSTNQRLKLLSISIFVAISFILLSGYLRIISWNRLNRFLFYPGYCINANAFECGFHFSRNTDLFFRTLDGIPDDLKNDYFKGAGVSWSYNLRAGRIEEFRNTINKRLDLMDNSEKTVFFTFLLKGESVETGPDATNAQSVLYQDLSSSIVKEEDRELLNTVRLGLSDSGS